MLRQLLHVARSVHLQLRNRGGELLEVFLQLVGEGGDLLVAPVGDEGGKGRYLFGVGAY